MEVGVVAHKLKSKPGKTQDAERIATESDPQ
jgi:hypothetical protein